MTAKGKSRGPATAAREVGSVDEISEEEQIRRKIEAKEKAAKAKKRAAGRGIEGKYVYSLQKVAKYLENEPLFQNVSLSLLQGYEERKKPTVSILNGEIANSQLFLLFQLRICLPYETNL